MAGWTHDLGLLRAELIQRDDEGAAVPEGLRRRIAGLDDHRAWDHAAIDGLWDELDALPSDPDLAAREPDELSAIRSLRPAERVDDCGWRPGDEELLDRLHGAWACRASGCALGKPVEGPSFRRDAEGRLCGRRDIKDYLQGKGAWPLADYFPADAEGDPIRFAQGHASTRERIAYMEADDDIHYTLVGLAVLERCGPDFGWSDVALAWCRHLPYAFICTAETQALLNFLNRSSRSGALADDCTPAWTRRHHNPYREWIGAQIRVDGWAWACAGKPELAAEFAWRDACWTHARNGIYGAMFCAAMQAAAFVERDPGRLVAIGLGQIPARCRLADAVREALDWIAGSDDWEAFMERLEERWLAMDPVHTINNALICVAALFYGRMEAVAAPAIAVAAGLDTDCNGATVGSIVGAGIGRAAIDEGLIGRLDDSVRPAMIGFQEIAMRDLAERHAVQWRRIDDRTRR